MKKILAVLFAFALPFLFAGCANLQVSDNFQTKLAVQQGTLRVIQDDPGRAYRVQEIVADVRPHLESDHVTLGLLDAYARDQIRWEKLSIADAQLLTMVLDEAKLQLEARFGAGLLDPETRQSVALFLDWIEDSATLVILMKGAQK